MNATRSGTPPDDGDTRSWTSETLPLSLRRELLERELNKLGFRKGAQGSSRDGPVAQQQQQAQGESSHPRADGDGEQ
jgi:hypothetical protein